MMDFRIVPGARSSIAAFTVATLFAGANPAAAQAQEPQLGEVTGRVTYSGTGQGVAGALVTLRAAGLGVLTNREGRYTIRGVPAGRHVALTALMGCVLVSRTVEVETGRRAALDVALDPPVIDLAGILVTAEAPAAQDPFAVTRVETDGRVPASGGTRSVASMLQGTAAGVRVVQGSGQPGSEASILLRGPTSLVGSQEPLVVVDGVITQGRLSDIDPFDVQSVEVLKGAAAAASYGSRGQAGVIQITTRRGPGQPASRPLQPVLLVDGVITAGSLADLDVTSVAEMRKLEGPVAAALYGKGAEAGAIEVTTLYGPPPGAPVLRPACLDPDQLRQGSR